MDWGELWGGLYARHLAILAEQASDSMEPLRKRHRIIGQWAKPFPILSAAEIPRPLVGGPDQSSAIRVQEHIEKNWQKVLSCSNAMVEEIFLPSQIEGTKRGSERTFQSSDRFTEREIAAQGEYEMEMIWHKHPGSESTHPG